jgi:AcrR family transcriptional regulator
MSDNSKTRLATANWDLKAGLLAKAVTLLRRYDEAMAETWRETAKAQRREQYLKAAARLFSQRGFNGVSIEELGAAVGVSGPALYRHFQSKEDMLTELLMSVSERLVDGYAKIVDEGRPDIETLQGLVNFHIDFALSEADVIRVQERELGNLPEAKRRRIRRLQRQYIDGWVLIVSRMQPTISTAELDVRMHAVFGILNSTPYSEHIAMSADVRRILADMAMMSVLGGVGSETFTA